VPVDPATPGAPTLRLAGPADRDHFLALEAACFAPDRRYSPAIIQRALTSPHQRAWVIADASGAVLAGLIAWSRPRTWRVVSVAVLPEARGAGHFTRLMEHYHDAARRAGAGRSGLEADAENAPLIARYEHADYHVVARLKDYYGPGQDAQRMERAL